MKIEERAMGEIIPYENNPRKNEDAIEPVANSIRAFGFRQPIVVDRDGVIVVGHTRYLAAQRLGMDTVPVHVADNLSEEQIKAYRLADNKTNEIAGWDFVSLDSEIAGIEEIDMEQFGFDLDMLADGIGGGIESHDDVDLDKATGEEIECPSCGFTFEV